MASGGPGERDDDGGRRPSEGPSPAFYRRVLDELPSAAIVVDGDGHVIYGNAAMLALGGWSEEAFGSNIIEFLHPDDAEWVADAFVTLAADRVESSARTRWAAVQFRMVANDGTEIPIEVSGTGALTDPEIGGIIYTVTPAHSQELLSGVLTGIASGAPTSEMLANVVEIIAAPPLDLDAAILRPTSAGDYEVMVSTSPELHSALCSGGAPLPWAGTGVDVEFISVADMPATLAVPLAAAGYCDLWHVAVESRMTSSTFRIVACSPTHHVPATGVINRLARARELAAVVLLRSQTDVLLAHAAFHDHLTQLTNRAGLMNQIDDVGARDDHALIVLYVDLDGFKPVNDEYGHDAGDLVLQVTADRLRAESRSGDLVARVGGDEFVLVLGPPSDRLTANERAAATAERLVTAIGQPIDIGGVAVRVSASIGVVVSESDDTIKQLITQADQAMFEAKRAGGDRGHLAAPDGPPDPIR